MEVKKRVIIVASGKSIHTYNFIDLVKDYFDQVLLITDIDDAQHKQVQKKIIPSSLQKPLKAFPLVARYRKAIRTFKPNLIITMQLTTAAFLIQRANIWRIKSILICFGSDVLLTPYRNKVLKLMAKYVLAHNQYFNTGSEWVAQSMLRLRPSIKEVMISNFGIDSVLDCVKEEEKQDIIFSNRLHSSLYRLPKIMEAFARFVSSPQRQSWRLVIAASGDEDKLKKKAKALGIADKVDFVGWLSKEQNAHYYMRAKIWVSIPVSDSIPISLLEAMRGGCLPVVSDLGSTNSFLSKDGAVALIAKDLEGNFFESAMCLLSGSQREVNKKIAVAFGDKDINRQNFYTMFDKAYKE